MVQENHAVLSPAHRRNQNPLSPSSSVFRRSSTFSRDETDLSWNALIRRHRFLLSMLALLMFLCTIYLYFAIKLGSDDCSGLIGNEETLCRLKRSNAKISHGHKSSRKLLNVQESVVKLLSRTQNHILNPEIPYMSGGLHLIDFLVHEDNIKSVLVLGRLGDHLMDYLIGNYEVSKLNLDCEVLQEGQEGNDVNLSYGYHRMGFLYPPQQFDLIISQNCSLRHFQFPDGNKIWNMMYFLRYGGFLLSIFDESTEVNSDESVFTIMQLHRLNGIKLVQK